ncbi:MAG: alpha-E domain-containing protein [Gammaproteobacteria bacterium]|nr:alpha-E domain-containing protein [Gammaproteobacteria bacterium]
MLSKVAERVYWMVRYLERAEDGARLISVYGDLLLDLPRSAGLGWKDITPVLGVPKVPVRGRRAPTDAAVLRFLLLDPRNPGSLRASIANARENARTTRDLLPTEAWRAVNELHLFATKQLARSVAQRHRNELLGELVHQVQQITGLLTGTMSHGAAYQFLRIGRYLERAEMTTRIVDVAAALLMTGRKELAGYENTLWMAVLRSLSGYQMYRQHVRRRVHAADVLHYLLQDREFPRAVTYCMHELEAASGKLPKSAALVRLAARYRRDLGKARLDRLDLAEVHQLVDQLQQRFGTLHKSISATWFHPDMAPRRSAGPQAKPAASA